MEMLLHANPTFLSLSSDSPFSAFEPYTNPVGSVVQATTFVSPLTTFATPTFKSSPRLKHSNYLPSHPAPTLFLKLAHDILLLYTIRGLPISSQSQPIR